MGLSVFPYINSIIEKRKIITQFYAAKIPRRLLSFRIRKNTEWNSSYFPIIFESEKNLTECTELFMKNQIYPRRYFYPSLNTLNYVEYQKMMKSENISRQILCLPLYDSLQLTDVHKIVRLLNIL